MKKFCLVPTIGAQNIISRRGGEGGEYLYDQSYDSEFIFSYRDNGKLKKKRVSRGEFAAPGTGGSAKQIGVIAARTTVFIIVGLLVGVPTLIVMIMLIVMAANGFK